MNIQWSALKYINKYIHTSYLKSSLQIIKKLQLNIGKVPSTMSISISNSKWVVSIFNTSENFMSTGIEFSEFHQRTIPWLHISCNPNDSSCKLNLCSNTVDQGFCFDSTWKHKFDQLLCKNLNPSFFLCSISRLPSIWSPHLS